jgi:hypothetical protein
MTKYSIFPGIDATFTERNVGPKHDPYVQTVTTFHKLQGNSSLRVTVCALADSTKYEFYMFGAANPMRVLEVKRGMPSPIDQVRSATLGLFGKSLEELTELLDNQMRDEEPDPMGHPSRPRGIPRTVRACTATTAMRSSAASTTSSIRWRAKTTSQNRRLKPQNR